MARTRTLSELRSDARWQADIEGLTVRYTDARITRALNQSIQEFREALSDAGDPYYLTQSTGSLTVGATSPYPFGALTVSALSPALLRVYGLDIKVGDRWVNLEPISFEQRNQFQPGWLSGSTTTGQPCAFFMFNATQVAYSPAADRAYEYILYYLPVPTDLSADGDTLDGVAGWEEWVVFNAVSKLHTRDSYLQQAAQIDAERSRLMQGILSRSRKRQHAGATRRVDVRARKRFAELTRLRYGV